MSSKGEYQPKVSKIAAEIVAVKAAGGDPERVTILVERLHVAERECLAHVIDEVECIPEERDNYPMLREALIYLRALAKVLEQGF